MHHHTRDTHKMASLQKFEFSECFLFTLLLTLTVIVVIINQTKNFNAGAVIATPTGNFLHKSTSYDIWIIRISPPVFCTAHFFYPTSKSYALQCFLISQTPPQVPLFMGASMSPCNTRSGDPPDSAFLTASRSVQTFLHRLRQRVPILYSVH